MEILNNISELTNPLIDLKRITVYGLKLGDSQNNIPKEIITEGPHGGWLHTNKGIVIRILENGDRSIAEFLLRPGLLDNLKIQRKEHISNVFGTPEAVEQKLGTTYYFYPGKKLVVAWDNTKDQISGIYIGDNIIQQTEFRIKDFLDKYYEFKAMVPNYKEWNSKSLRQNSSRYYRFKELESLLSAFNIGTDLLEDYQNRNFLNNRNLADFEPMVKNIEKYAVNNSFEKERYTVEFQRFRSARDFSMVIQEFMRFSEEMRNILKFNSGWLETGSISSRYLIYKTQKLLDNIDLTELREIEALLGKVLDPKDKVFTKYELIKNYDFPDVDLHTIDIDNY
jgi:hypothetical protein